MIRFKLINSFSQTILSAKNGKSNLYTSDTTSIPVTGLLTLENVLLEKSIIDIDAIEVSKIPIKMAILTSLFFKLKIRISSSSIDLYINHEAIKINQNNPCSNN